VRDAFQLGLAPRELGLVDERAVPQAAAALRGDPRTSSVSLEQSLRDAVARGLVSEGTAAGVLDPRAKG